MNYKELEQVELSRLLGKHKLTGVDFETDHIKQYDWDESLTDCQVIRFRIDGKTYLAMENPSDGYRSSMEKLIIIDKKPKTTFPPVWVLGIMKPDGYYHNNTIQFYDIETGKIVLEVGTDNADDYYPSFVACWTPENLILNKDHAKKV